MHGAPAGFQEPVYGSQAFSDHRNAASAHFLGKGSVLGKMFNYSSSDHLAAAATSAKGELVCLQARIAKWAGYVPGLFVVVTLGGTDIVFGHAREQGIFTRPGPLVPR